MKAGFLRLWRALRPPDREARGGAFCDGKLQARLQKQWLQTRPSTRRPAFPLLVPLLVQVDVTARMKHCNAIPLSLLISNQMSIDFLVVPDEELSFLRSDTHI